MINSGLPDDLNLKDLVDIGNFKFFTVADDDNLSNWARPENTMF